MQAMDDGRTLTGALLRQTPSLRGKLNIAVGIEAKGFLNLADWIWSREASASSARSIGCSAQRHTLRSAREVPSASGREAKVSEAG